MNKKLLILFLVLLTSINLFAMGTKEEVINTSITQEQTSDGLDLIASKLGVTTDELASALGDPSQGKPDFENVAAILNVDALLLEELMQSTMEGPSVEVDPYTININGVDFTITYKIFTWEDLPSDVNIEKEGIREFTSEDGTTHYYETIYLPSGNLNWYQAAYLAQKAGGYLACLNTEEENDFVFSLVNDDKYFWHFEENGEHYGISIGPFLGGYQIDGSIEPAGGWTWLSGESFDYTNWAVNLDDGIIDLDPRDNSQPNDSGDGQPVMGFGEMNLPVSTWGDYMDSVGTYGGTRLPGRCYGFVIEYENDPK
jgi:hypothetical protein